MNNKIYTTNNSNTAVITNKQPLKMWHYSTMQNTQDILGHFNKPMSKLL